MGSQIAIPFALANDGTIAVETFLDRQVRQRIEALAGTEPGERVMLPGYGVPTTSLLFEPDNPQLLSIMEDSVRNSLALYEPGANLVSVTPVTTVEQGVVGVEVDFTLNSGNSTTPLAASANTAIVYSTGTVVEEVVG
jgi:hypothetical protein